MSMTRGYVLLLPLLLLSAHVRAQGEENSTSTASLLSEALKCSQEYLGSVGAVGPDLAAICALLAVYKSCMNQVCD